MTDDELIVDQILQGMINARAELIRRLALLPTSGADAVERALRAAIETIDGVNLMSGSAELLAGQARVQAGVDRALTLARRHEARRLVR